MSAMAQNKKLVVLNDDLEQAVKDIETITKYGVKVDALAYFHDNRRYPEISEDILKCFEDLNVKIIHVETFDFYYILETMYEDCDIVFLFDIDLGIEEGLQPNYRIQVSWARHKVINDNGKDRFFFYSTCLAPSNLAKINSRFPNKILEFNKLSSSGYPEILPKKNKEFCNIFGI